MQVRALGWVAEGVDKSIRGVLMQVARPMITNPLWTVIRVQVAPGSKRPGGPG